MIAPLFGSITRPLLSPLVSGLRDELFGAFTPRSLFNDGSIGVLYDNNDLTSFYLDASGTTPATVNGLVGLQLDKSAGLVLGAELVPTGDYAGTVDGGFSFSGRTIVRNGVVGTNGALLTLTSSVVIGRHYQVSMTVSGLTGDPLIARVGGTGGAVFYSITTNGNHTFLIQASLLTNARLQVSGLNGTTGTATVSNISVKELPGNHRYQTTTGSKPILRGTPTGAELFTAYGTPGAGWSVAGATGTATTASSALPTTTAATVGKHYRVTYTVTRSAGSVQLSFGGRTGVSRSAAGQYVEYFDNALNTNALTATGTGFTGTVRIDEVKDVSAGSVTAPYGLQYDGVDDFLQTASVNFSATDKMFVCAGVRKLSDSAADSYLLALSASPANTGSFFIRAPRLASTAHYGFTYNASTAAGYDASSYAAPAVNVLSASMNGAGATQADKLIPRVNGATPTLGLIGVSSGTGNFGNHAFYFGRLGGTSGPFNGLDFGFVIVGKTLTAAQISSTERWMAQRTGVSI